MLNARQYENIKRNVANWHKIDRDGVDPDALWDMFVECRNAFQLVLDTAEENRPPTIFERIRGVFSRG